MSQADQIINNNQLLNTANWFIKARPEPTQKDFATQLGCFFEEVAETIEHVHPTNGELGTLLRNTQHALERLGDYLKAHEDTVEVGDPVLFLDGLCDTVVTATGTAHTKGYQFLAAMDEVNRSNFSKFDDQGNPIFNENKKVLKGPNYSPADLTAFV